MNGIEANAHFSTLDRVHNIKDVQLVVHDKDKSNRLIGNLESKFNNFISFFKHIHKYIDDNDEYVVFSTSKMNVFLYTFHNEFNLLLGDYNLSNTFYMILDGIHVKLDKLSYVIYDSGKFMYVYRYHKLVD